MSAQDPIPFFEALYEETYPATLRLVTRGCADADRIPDLMQDIYADVYAAILTRGTAYFTNPAETRLLAAQAAEGLKTFAPETRRIILCRIELDMPFAEIAKLLGMKEITVKMRYYRALAELRELYQKEGADL